MKSIKEMLENLDLKVEELDKIKTEIVNHEFYGIEFKKEKSKEQAIEIIDNELKLQGYEGKKGTMYILNKKDVIECKEFHYGKNWEKIKEDVRDSRFATQMQLLSRY